MPESIEPTEVFPVRLRNARIARNLSQSELARLANLQPSAVSHFETGTRKPSFDNLKRLADALRVTTDYLLGRTDLMDASAATVDKLHRHYSGLSAEHQEMADEFIEMLAQRARQKRTGGENVSRQHDQFFKAHQEAEQLLRELGADTLPIDPFAIARELDIEMKPLPASAGGASGMLLHVGGVFGIGYPTHIDNEGFRRFSVAHEIGHYRLPGHIDAVLDTRGHHFSKAGFRSTNRYELEADQFASALLMPAKLFIAAIGRAGDGLQAIEVLQARCETSLEATAIRYAQTSRDPVAVIRSGANAIDYAFMSSSLKDFRGLDWIRKGTPLPADSVTADFNADAENIARGRRAEGQSCLQDWFNGPHSQEIIEEVVGLGSYGKTLTVLTGMESPDEVDDDDGDLEESWTVRFR